jgi:hypothetical protein
LFPHLHVVVLDGAYVEDTDGALHFEATRAPTESDVAFVSRAVANRLGRYLKKHGFIDADELETPPSPPMRWYAGLLREPAGYADVDDAGALEARRVGAQRRSTGEAQGFSVHAEVTVAAHDAAGRERLCRYAARPPLADAQLSMSWARGPGGTETQVVACGGWVVGPVAIGGAAEGRFVAKASTPTRRGAHARAAG